VWKCKREYSLNFKKMGQMPEKHDDYISLGIYNGIYGQSGSVWGGV
jgi:hypothetical protein